MRSAGNRGQHSGQQRRFACAGASGNQEGQPRPDDVLEQDRRIGRYGAAARQCGQILRGRSQHSQRQARAALGYRRQHGMQPDTELTRAQSRQLAVHPRLRFVEAPTRRQGKTLRKPSHSGFVCKSNCAAVQSVSVVHPHRVGGGDEDIGGAVCTQYRFQDAGTGQFCLKHAQTAQHLGVAEHATGLGANGGGHHIRPQRTGLGGQPLAHPVDQ
jgi:hypothetical protein